MKKLLLAIIASAFLSTPALADHRSVNVTVYPTGSHGYENGRQVKYHPRFRPAPVVVTITDHRNSQVHMVPIRNQYNSHYHVYDSPRNHRRNRDAEKVINGFIAGALIYDMVKD